jgi:UMF1 family MFS transporter
VVAEGRRSVLAWSAYDLANTIFSFNVLSFYFPVWAKETLGAADSHLSIAFSASMVFVALASPLAGALSDRLGRRIPLLAVTTTICVAATIALGVGPLPVALVLYAVANAAFQLGLVFYDALLPAVSEATNVGQVGGVGISAGYLGSFLGLGVGALLLETLADPHPWIFAATGVMFLGFAIPCFVWVPDAGSSRTPEGSLLSEARRTLAAVRSRPNLARFLASRFAYTDAANTLIVFMGVYATQSLGFTERAGQLLLGIGIAAAILSGVSVGRWVDRAGAKPVLVRVLLAWIAALGLAAAVPLLGWPQWTFWPVAALAGACLGATWAADRPLMLELIPEGRVGEFYGLYGMVGRFAAVLGPLMWGAVVDGPDWDQVPFVAEGRPIAVLALAASMGVALALLAGVQVEGEPS